MNWICELFIVNYYSCQWVVTPQCVSKNLRWIVLFVIGQLNCWCEHVKEVYWVVNFLLIDTNIKLHCILKEVWRSMCDVSANKKYIIFTQVCSRIWVNEFLAPFFKDQNFYRIIYIALRDPYIIVLSISISRDFCPTAVLFIWKKGAW